MPTTFTQSLFDRQINANLIPLETDPIVPGVNVLKKYRDLDTNNEYIGYYSPTLNHLQLYDGRSCGYGDYIIQYDPLFIVFPSHNVLFWNFWRNGSSTIIRTRAALDGFNFSPIEPSQCHVLTKYENKFPAYDWNVYRDYKHVAVVQNGEDRFIKLVDYWWRTIQSPVRAYAGRNIPPRKHSLYRKSTQAFIEMLCGFSYFNSFAPQNHQEPHMLPQWKRIQCLPVLDRVIELKDLTSFFQDEMGIPCKEANREASAPVITRDIIPDELQTLIAHVYKKDSEIKIGEYVRPGRDEEEPDENLTPILIKKSVAIQTHTVEKEIIGMWLGPQLPASAQLSIKSHIDHGFSYKLFVYSHLFHGIDTVPKGCQLLEANDIIDKSEIFKNKAWNSWAPFSDYWRYAYLARYGGIWADLDFICLRDWSPVYWFYNDGTKEKADTCFISFLNVPKELPLIKDLYNSWLYPNDLDKQASWIQNNLAKYYEDDDSLPLSEQRGAKYYGWAGHSWMKSGIAHYGLQNRIGAMLAEQYWSSRKWKEFFDGTVTPEDPRLSLCSELQLHGAMFAAGTGGAGLANKAHPDSIFTYLWNKHMGGENNGQDKV